MVVSVTLAVLYPISLLFNVGYWARKYKTFRKRLINWEKLSDDEKIYTNAQMGPRHIRKHCVLTVECERIMENAITKLGFSARGYDRILKRFRTTRCTNGAY